MGDDQELSPEEFDDFKDAMTAWFLNLNGYRNDGRPKGSIPVLQDILESLIFSSL